MSNKRKPQILCIRDGRRTKESIKYLIDNHIEVGIDLKDRQTPTDIVIYKESKESK